MKQKLTKLLNKLDSAHVECDGFTNLASAILRKNNINHIVMMGTIGTPEGRSLPHLWIEVENLVVDYRARMWAGEKAPHGVFDKSDHMEHYLGKEVQPTALSDVIFSILSGMMIDDFNVVNG